MALDFIHEFIAGESRSTVLALHGTGGDEHDLLPLVKSLDPSASILSPRGRVDENGMNRFFRRFAEGQFDEPNLIAEASALSEFVKQAAGEYGFDAANLCGLGFSNGANMAASLLLLHPKVLASAVLIRAMVPIEPAELPDLAGKKVLLLSGEFDPILPIDNAKRLASMLREAGATVDHHILQAGHNLTREDVEIAKAWLAAL